jgi:hypothetical protein
MKQKFLWIIKSNGNWSSVTKSHMIDELIKSGYTIEIIYINESLKQFNNELQQTLKENVNSVLISQYNHKTIYIESLEVAKKIGVKTLLIASDTLVDSNYYRKVCRYYDLVWIFDNTNSNLFYNWGANVITLPYAANKYLFKIPKKRTTFISKVLFYGTPYGSRVSQINLLLKNSIYVDIISGFNENKSLSNNTHSQFRVFSQIKSITQLTTSKIGIKILLGKLVNLMKNEKLNYSSPYLNFIESVDYSELYNKIYEYKLTLTPGVLRNTGNLNRPIYVPNLRHFETPSAGGIMLVDSEIPVSNYYRSKIDYLILPSDGDYTIIKEFLAKGNDSIRKLKLEIARNTLNYHSWSNRFNKIIELIVDMENEIK